ncbi:YqaJ viral recombinase family protein [Corynebacterium striatum]|uniref:YqaJ viral recombinase family nuclease n=1 Tax=Corynebacterium striatum TaxID=43770 RepID=UPI00254DBD3A|nr:YqaJ viral recombinase family protein [Corynebacterium striatum]MDK8811573.1 YqaJ viral recombinase family protein [Corynebacterium striatum]
MNNTTYAELPTTNNRAEWLEQRQGGIGSSDASAIAGLSSFESPYSLWEIKTGRAPLDPPVDRTTQRLREWGNRLEPVILEATADELGIPITKPETGFYNLETPWLRANLDGITADGRICEFKTVHGSQAQKWDGQIADHAEIQVHHAGLVTGITHAVVAALIGGNDFRVYEIELNPRIQEMLLDMEQKFWQHVLDGTRPDVDGHARTLEALTREWANRPGSKEVPPEQIQDLHAEWLEAIEREKQAKQDVNQLKAQFTSLMDGHETLSSDQRIWAKVRRGRVNTTRLEREHPNIAKEVTRLEPTIDTQALKAKHPDIYKQMQSVSVQPVKEH